MLKRAALILIGLLMLVGTAQAVTFDNANGGSWQKYININFTAAITEYAQYRVYINGSTVEVYNVTGALEGSGTTTDFWTLVNTSSGWDIRVFNQTYKTSTNYQDYQLYFWLQYFNATEQKAEIWVNVSAGSSELNIAYGNPSALPSSYNNASFVYEFYDDFESGIIDTSKWDIIDVGSWSVVLDGSSYVLKGSGTGVDYTRKSIRAILKNNETLKDFVAEFDWRTSTDAVDPGALGNFIYRAQGTNIGAVDRYWVRVESRSGYTEGAKLLKSVAGVETNLGTLVAYSPTNVYHHWTVIVNGTSHTVIVEGVGSGTLSDSDISLAGYMGFQAEYYDVYIDNFKVLKFADPADVSSISEYAFEVNFTVSLVSPTNASIVNTSTVSFTFNIDGTAVGFNATLFIDNIAKWNGSAVAGDNTVNLPVPDGSHTWYVEVTGYNSTTNITKTTDVWTFTVDANPPKVETTVYDAVIQENQPLNVSIKWSDTVGITKIEFYVNENGNWTLITSQIYSNLKEAWLNATYTNTSNKTSIEFKQVAYDVAGNSTTYTDTVQVVSTLVVGSGNYVFYFRFVNESGGIINSSDVEYIKFISIKLNKAYTLTNETAVTYLTTTPDDELRIEFKYTTSTDVISRDFDIRLLYDLGLERQLIKVEIPSTLTQFYEQLIYSATSKPVIVKNVVTQSYLAAANTKYVYQDALMLPVYTVTGMYYLYTYEDGKLVALGTIDGGRSVMINLDIIQASRQSYSITILSDDLSISKEYNNTLKIYYKNNKNDAVESTITVLNTKTNELLFNHTETTSPNEMTVYFDYTTLNVSSDTLLKVIVTVKDKNGNTRTVERLFNLNGESGQLNPAVATFLALSTAIFGLTLVSTRHAFGLIGMIILVAALAIATLGVSVWYVKFTQGVIVVLLIYSVLVYRYENVEVN